MKKENKYWVLGAMVLAGVAAFAFIRLKGKSPVMALSGDPYRDNQPGAEELKIGAKGNKVAELQQWLSEQSPEAAQLIRSSGGIDGIFGPATMTALQIVTGQTTIMR